MEDRFSNTYYIHIPKTGGSTLSEVLRTKYKVNIQQYHNDDNSYPAALLKKT